MDESKNLKKYQAELQKIGIMQFLSKYKSHCNIIYDNQKQKCKVSFMKDNDALFAIHFKDFCNVYYFSKFSNLTEENEALYINFSNYSHQPIFIDKSDLIIINRKDKINNLKKELEIC